MKISVCALVCLFGLASANAYAALAEKNLRADLAYYSRTAKLKDLSANDRLYILDRLRQKYKNEDLDQSELYREIDVWTAKKEKEKKAPRQKAEAASAPTVVEEVIPEETGGKLAKALVTESKSASRLILDIPGTQEFKDEIKRGSKMSPPVILIYLYNTKNDLPARARNFGIQNGIIRQVQSQSLAGTPATIKVSVSLREDKPYKIEKRDDQLVLTLDKMGSFPAEVAASTGDFTESLSSAVPAIAEPVQTTAKKMVEIMGAVKTPGRYEVKEGMRLMEAVYSAGGFTSSADIENVKVARGENDAKLTRQVNAKEILNGSRDEDIAIFAGDSISVPEKTPSRAKNAARGILPWASFLVSLGVVLALLI